MRVLRVTELTPQLLSSHGIHGLVCDLDNTLVVHNKQDVAQDVAAWLATVRRAGIGVCLLSNTRRLWRLSEVGEAHGLSYVPKSAGKPGVANLRDAIRRLGVDNGQAAMVGDQLFTDILCGNRLGITTVLVTPISPVDCIGTRLISRPLERLVERQILRQ